MRQPCLSCGKPNPLCVICGQPADPITGPSRFVELSCNRYWVGGYKYASTHVVCLGCALSNIEDVFLNHLDAIKWYL